MNFLSKSKIEISWNELLKTKFSMRHSNTYGTGTQVIKDLKRDFNFTAAETISLMSLHGLNTHTKTFEEAFKYKWLGGIRTDNTSIPGKITNLRKGTFSNVYYKMLNGKVYASSNVNGGNKYDYYRLEFQFFQHFRNQVEITS